MIISLNGLWNYRKDPTGTGRFEDYLTDEGEWKEMSIPNNWQLAGVDDYCGVIWFKRTFSKPEEVEGKEVWIKFYGVDYFADVWLNGEHIGSHEGYFQPFKFNVTPLIEEENILLVRVDSPYEEPRKVWPAHKTLIKGIFGHHDCRPGSSDPEKGQTKNTGGIWNKVELVISDKVRLEGMKVSPCILKSGKAILTTNLKIANDETTPVEAKVAIDIVPANFKSEETYALAKEVRLNPGENEIVFVKTIEKPYLWNTWDHGEPNLYKLKSAISREDKIVAQSETEFGIRSIEIDKDWRWFLNGKQIFVRGTNIIPTQWLSEYDAEMINKDMELLKGANINGVRIHAHVNREEFYAACDSAGILVWQDFALQWGYQASDAFANKAVTQIKDMVRCFYNHPSIVVWCCHNEPTHNRHVLDPVLEIAVKEEDGTRFVTPASDFSQHTYPGWYWGSMEDYIALPQAPFVNEFGAPALPNLNMVKEMFTEEELNPQTQKDWKKWAYHDFQYDQTFNVAHIDRGENIEEFIANSQKYQYDLLKFAIENYRRAKYSRITSLFQFMFVDCWPSITCSVVDYYRQPKRGYEALRLAYQPVLVSMSVTRRKMEIGSIFGLIERIAVVNDLYEEFKGATLELFLEDSAGNRIDLVSLPLDISADSVTDVSFFSLEDLGSAEMMQFLKGLYETLASLKPGDYLLKAKLMEATGKILSENQEEITFVPPMIPMPLPF